MLASWRKGYEKPRQCTKKQRHHFANKGQCSQTYGFSISHVWMWELDQKEGWVQKNWCFRTVVLEKTLKSALDCKEVRPVNPKGNLWIFIGRTDAEAPVLWPPDAKCWLIGNHPDDRKVWGQEDKGETEDKTVGWHNQFSGHESEQTLGDSEGWGSLLCCSPGKEVDTAEQLNKNDSTYF